MAGDHVVALEDRAEAADELVCARPEAAICYLESVFVQASDVTYLAKAPEMSRLTLVFKEVDVERRFVMHDAVAAASASSLTGNNAADIEQRSTMCLSRTQ